jgi:ATP-dependent DNA helicase RecG
MAYTLNSPIESVQGVGDISTKNLKKAGITTVKDLLLTLPLSYEDRSQRSTLDSAKTNELYTFQLRVLSKSNFYRNRRSIQKATVQDLSGKKTAMWFNNSFILKKLIVGESYLFSGKINDKGVLLQPTVEDLKDAGLNIHTDRIVPLYSSKLGIKVGTLRRIFKEILSNFYADDLIFEWLKASQPNLPSLMTTFNDLHFPENEKSVVLGRKRLALEELLALIAHSKKLKQKWQERYQAQSVTVKNTELIPKNLPYNLTSSQQRTIQEITQDLKKSKPMNRLLVGDVGSGKTVVAGISAWHTIRSGFSVALIAPTQILAKQHASTLTQLFPALKIQLVINQTKKNNHIFSNANDQSSAVLYVGTHSVINKLKAIKPNLIIFDEQHRFGVEHRSAYLGDFFNQKNQKQLIPHVLTMTATPIPRSYMLTIFNHLQLSTLDQMPIGRKVSKTYLTPDEKRDDGYGWIFDHLTTDNSQAIHVCPFIDTSSEPAFENIASALKTYESVTNFLKTKKKHNLKVGLLHGKQTVAEKNQVIQDLYNQKINWLVTTPVVEVGLDLPKADIIVIEACERFGLASLHQLRGRVGRAGQQGHCILFASQQKHLNLQRLAHFSKETNGFALAEYDLKNRGGGNIFGTEQHGVNKLKFASWADLSLINLARSIYENYLDNQDSKSRPVAKKAVKTSWKPLIFISSNNLKTEKKIASN